MERTAADEAPGAVDAELVRQVRDEGCSEAFDILVDRHGDRIYSVVFRMIGDAEKARDLTQETFLKAWRALDSFAGAASFYTWLYRIARNLVSSEGRRLRARPRVVASLGEPFGGDGSGPSIEVASGEPGAEERLMRTERQKSVLDAIGSLVPDFREIIVLRDLEDHSYEEMAELLEIPVGTVRSRLHRARLELKAKLVDLY